MIVIALFKFTKIVNDEKQHEELILNPIFKSNSKKRECNVAKKVKNKEQEGCLKKVIVEVLNIAKSFRITSTPSTTHLQTTFKQGGETKGAYKIKMKEILQNIIPSYLTLSSFLMCAIFSFPFFSLLFLLNLLHFHSYCFNPRNKEEERGNEILHMLWCVLFICLFTLFYMILQDGQGN
jgi:hypothetical protein